MSELDIPQEFLNRFRHREPSLHLIGETIGPPIGVESVSSTGAGSVGTSPYPARADHVHGLPSGLDSIRSDFDALDDEINDGWQNGDTFSFTSSGTAVNIGASASKYGRYKTTGKFTYYRGFMSPAGSGFTAGTGFYLLSLPVNLHSEYASFPELFGMGTYKNNGGTISVRVWFTRSTSGIVGIKYNPTISTEALVSATVPFALTTGCTLQWEMYYGNP